MEGVPHKDTTRERKTLFLYYSFLVLILGGVLFSLNSTTVLAVLKENRRTATAFTNMSIKPASVSDILVIGSELATFLAEYEISREAYDTLVRPLQ